jgi:Arc/MetJ-type ribon-helix-helix transcriptional regulator
MIEYDPIAQKYAYFSPTRRTNMPHTVHPPARRRTTLDLPAPLADEIQQAVKQGLAKSQNSLIVHAIEAYLERLQDAWIDAQFAQMADDKEAQSLHLQVAKEFEQSDWEALRIGEAHP